MHIIKTETAYEIRELKSPFGFKGSALTGLWQTAVTLTSDRHSALGLGVQSVLWSDSEIFAKYGEEKGNQMMFEVTKYATKLLMSHTFETPYEVLGYLLPRAIEFGRQLTKDPNLRQTFILNSLVPIDLAAWTLYAKENHLDNFETMTKIQSGLRQDRLVNIPLITYHTSLEEVTTLASSGYSLFKIKIGSDPEHDGDLDKMLEWDKNRFAELDRLLKQYETPFTTCNHPVYYLDANGRYDTKERLMDFLSFADKIGALHKIVLLEEPFSEENKIDVHDLSVCVAADESAHCLEDAKERICLGYRAIALKPIAKTLSMTLRILDYALKAGIACFCADLTVNPIMVEWNKNLAARLSPIDGMKVGVVESNGSQNYTDWNEMLTHHPMYGKDFVSSQNGVYHLDDEFYQTDGGIFITPEYYKQMMDL
jgi:L-alanine-DL-glutamate epimerase-like enolase superfamily enzyme